MIDELGHIRKTIIDAAHDEQISDHPDFQNIIREADSISDVEKSLNDAITGTMRDFINLGVSAIPLRAVVTLSRHWSSATVLRQVLRRELHSQGISYDFAELELYHTVVITFEEEHDYTMAQMILEGKISGLVWGGTI